MLTVSFVDLCPRSPSLCSPRDCKRARSLTCIHSFFCDSCEPLCVLSPSMRRNSSTSLRRRRLESSSPSLVGTMPRIVRRDGRGSRSPPSVRSRVRTKHLRALLLPSRRGTTRVKRTSSSSQLSSVVMREGSKVRGVTSSSLRLADHVLDGGTLFLFKCRSDRIREIATVLGKLDETVTPKPRRNSCAFCLEAGI